MSYTSLVDLSDWATAERVVSLAAQSLVARGETLGVRALFDREPIPEAPPRARERLPAHRGRRAHDILGSSPALREVLRQLADGGTLFLDEVGEIPLDYQTKLLRVLQEGTYERIGDAKTRCSGALLRTHDGTEVDFVVATERGLVAIEAKSSERWDPRHGAGLARFRAEHRGVRATFGVYCGARAPGR